MSDHPDARVACPMCGGEVHPIAGRCKHCKGDLAALRANRPRAAVTLPSLAAAATPAAAISEPLRREEEAPPILPPRPTAGTFAAAAVPKARWPIVVIGLSVAAIGTAVTVMVWPADRASAADPPAAAPAAGSGSPNARAEQPAAPPPPPQPLDLVRAPIATDLADYTGNLPGTGTLQANIDTVHGTIHCELLPDAAPLAVANFVGLATGKKPWLDRSGIVQRGKPFYDGLTFHRVIPEFMIQGGDPLGTGTGGPGYKFANEVRPDLKVEPGSLAMANAGPGTNGSQFFIAEAADDRLDGEHTIFGKCRDLAIVRRIARLTRDEHDKPVDPVAMTITITK